MTGQEEKMTKAEALKRAKEENKLDKMSNSILFIVEGKEKESLTLAQADLPDLPTLHFKNCRFCSYTIPEGTKIVKILFESCHDTKLEFKGCIVSTSIVEVWRSDRCELTVDCSIGTLQVDVCNDLTVTYSKAAHMGMVVQAGVQRLRLCFADGAAEEYRTGLDEIRAGQAGAEAVSINDTTDQCITRFVDGRLLTERILRLANDYPTTAREKARPQPPRRGRAAAPPRRRRCRRRPPPYCQDGACL
jgi:hypothetical protein